MGKIYLITGGAGHVGTAVASVLADMGERVRILALPNEKNLPGNGIEVFYGDVCDKQSMEEFFSCGDDMYVIHCAGIVSISSKYDSRVYNVNVGGTKNVVEMCIEHHVKKLVHVSSVHAIPENPDRGIIYETKDFDPDRVVGLYAKTKSEATAYVLKEAAEHGLDVSVVHPSGVCGPLDSGRGHITALVEAYCRHSLTTAVDGGYDFVDVRDVAQGIVSCCHRGRNGECYILSNRYFDIKEILHMLSLITGMKEIKTILPIWFVKLTAPLAEIYYRLLKRTPLYTAYSIYTLGSNSNFSHGKADGELGYETRDMMETLEDTVEWLKSKGRI